MHLRELVSVDAQFVDGPKLLQVRPQVLLLVVLGNLSDKQLHGVRFSVRTRRLDGAAPGQILNDCYGWQLLHGGGGGGGGEGQELASGFTRHAADDTTHGTTHWGQTHS